MPRYRLTIEYDGAPFVGWQRQDNGPSVQQVVEEALTRFTRAETAVVAAGRTDTGVHALGQVIHIDLAEDMPPERLMGALNFHMRPAPVAILDSAYAPEGFHARFSATGRRYLYRILNRRGPPAVDHRRVWHVPQPLDAGAMGKAAQILVGRHDFTTFRAVSCQAQSPVKTLDRLDVSRRGAEIHIEAAARSFLQHQVRSMVGTLKLVGEGKWTAADLRRALEARDRAALGFNCPPDGLYLIGVTYETALMSAPKA